MTFAVRGNLRLLLDYTYILPLIDKLYPPDWKRAYSYDHHIRLK